MQPLFRAPPHGTERADGSQSSSAILRMPQRRLNGILDTISHRFNLHGLQAQALPGAGVTLENGDALYFRANETVDTFDVYFRVDVPPAMLGRQNLIQLIRENCFSDNTPSPVLFIEAEEEILLFGFTGIEYDDMHADAERHINYFFSEYRNLVKFLRNEVY
ncbi:hypothetical protein PAN31117_03385 [Pandoraea anapnoica]|uniref:Uncharacterized protein n=1 Tax=Pandoraea anapnoica TaxID=2508301 RepID=A0A5E5A8Z6_9BURK|nr:hypothetical protein [Pandoraea anapnoica]VVE69606.1 hypothetical protein PAN31117_03385 [Pandoraea anapnoica]